MAYSLVDLNTNIKILRCQFNISMNSFLIPFLSKNKTSPVFSGCKYKTLFIQHPKFIPLFFVYFLIIF